MAKGTCEYCGKALTGRQTRFCCRRHARCIGKREARERGAAWAQNVPREKRLQDLTCSICRKEYRGHQPRTENPNNYCSPGCEGEGKRWAYLIPSVPIRWACRLEDRSWYIVRGRQTRIPHPASGPVCSVAQTKATGWRLFVGGECARCGKTFTHFTYNQGRRPRHCSERCAKADEKVARRAMLRLATIESVNRSRVFERDGYTCRLCGDPVEMAEATPHPLAPTIDHIVPLALGGDHSYANVQCAHFICNSRKGHTCEGQLAFAA